MARLASAVMGGIVAFQLFSMIWILSDPGSLFPWIAGFLSGYILRGLDNRESEGASPLRWSGGGDLTAGSTIPLRLARAKKAKGE